MSAFFIHPYFSSIFRPSDHMVNTKDNEFLYLSYVEIHLKFLFFKLDRNHKCFILCYIRKPKLISIKPKFYYYVKRIQKFHQ